MKLEEAKLYRITHISNIPHILQNGITHRGSTKANRNYISIGDTSLIENRADRRVYIDNGDKTIEVPPSVILGEFIPFYFGVRMPMLYTIQIGGNFVENPTHPQDIIYMACSLSSVLASIETFYFSDGHATSNFSSFYDQTYIAQLPSLIDWDAVKATYWGGQDNLNIKRKKQAEFLAKEDVPPDTLIGFGCYNEMAKSSLITMGIAEEKIKIIPNAYF
jgi:hypothetical protein